MNIVSDLAPTKDSLLALLTPAVFLCPLDLCLYLIFANGGRRGRKKKEEKRGEEREMETSRKRKTETERETRD